MASYIDEVSAKATIENIVKKYTNDYKLFVKSRKPIAADQIEKLVEFALILLPHPDNEDIYDELFSDIKIDSVSSTLFLDERSRQEKEVFYINVIVEVDYE